MFLSMLEVAAVVFTLVILATIAPSACAIQASRKPFTVTQPRTDKNVTLYIQGGERFQWMSDGDGIDGYTVVRNYNNTFVYAQLLGDGSIGPTRHVVGEVSPVDVGIEKNVLPTLESRMAVCKEKELLCADDEVINEDIIGSSRRSQRSLQNPFTVARGKVKNLVVLMQWSDHVGRTVPTEADIEILMNHEGPHDELAPTGSVRDVYLKNSYNLLDLNSTVYKWIVMDNTEVFYADGTSGNSLKLKRAIRYALDQLEEDGFDFGEFDKNGDGFIDAIAFLHSGYAAEWGGYDAYGTFYEDRIWSHQGSLVGRPWVSTSSGVKVLDYHISPALWGVRGSDIGRIGVIAHETGHFFGLPDLYDGQGFGQGIGSWCLMSDSWGFDDSQHYPPHLSAWARIRLGWDTATPITEPGTYELLASEEALDEGASATPRVYRIDVNYPRGEYLLVENRQPLYYDQLIPQGGLAIWHIDTTQFSGQGRQGFPEMPRWPQNGLHYRNALLQSDGKYQLEKGFSIGDEGDMYHADGVNEISQSAIPLQGPFPNTDAYKGGNVFKTGNRLYDISASGVKMTFKYEQVKRTDASAPSPAPTTSGRAPTVVIVLPVIATAFLTYVLCC